MKSPISLESNPKKLAFFLILPTLIAVFAILIYPILYSLTISFTSATLRDMSFNFIGLQNYFSALRDQKLGNAFILTIEYSAVTVFFKLLLGMSLALILNEKFIGRGLTRSLIIIPWAVPYIVTGIMWRWIFDSNIGIFNFILNKIGIINEYIAWLASRSFALSTIIIADVWQGTPFFIIILLAGLQTIPEDLYEAALVDGAGSFRKFVHITLPMIKFQIFIVIILGAIFAINQFDLFYIMTKGGPADSTSVATYYDYKIAFRYYKISYASAVSYLILLLTAIITIVYSRILQRSEK
ncbi:MAG: sugar ABC transporter permease [Actinobacteria bacterium]|nr:sugar ABC transporter permease [Actinomycetota bacterium]MBM3709518.1 sugar ABC transporter permease [Actinomycetota bacterium]MBM3713404.1 sugar ABC transporter permease [Actinomycetota bacterium]